MKRLVAVVSTLVLVSMSTTSAGATHLGKGNSMYWVGLNGSRAQIADDNLVLEPEDEVGVHLAASYFLTDAWTGIVSGGFDAARIRTEPASGPEFKESSRSWNIRFGFDRYAFINDEVALYAGPGVLYWTGHGAETGSPDYPDVTQVGLNGRIGMLAHFAPRWALFGHIGQVIATNSAKQSGDKLTWWSSSHEGSVGLSYNP